MLKISILSTTKNEEEHIGELLESLLNQEEPYEVIVVDAGSTDKTQEKVNVYSKKNPNIKLLICPGARPVSINYGIQRATGNAVAFIGGDDVADKDWVKEVRKGLQNADIIAGEMISKETDRFKALENVKLFHKGINISYPGSNTTYKKEILDKLDGFDTWFSSAEDLEINYRAVDAGYRISKNENAKVYYRPRNNLFSFLKQSFWYGYGRKLIGLKHGNIWGKHSAIDVVKTQLSLLGLVRLELGFLGYVYCVLTIRKYNPKEN